MGPRRDPRGRYGHPRPTVRAGESVRGAPEVRAAGIDTEGLEFDLEALGVEFHSFDLTQARATADVRARAPRAGLSLGDGACLALAHSLGRAAVTTDRRWSTAKHWTDVRVIR